ncbi:hypothetical protein D9757_007358 [Collybiopsis confluens]|uniref:Fucose-specific lectin n=1 Tax=Collybiopsis confluens TaxID=2823264 RepID=A0A8H5M7Y9_9AGAR|nr:hypothetical protein D9757_007358 [Collybiopsis confluens]
MFLVKILPVVSLFLSSYSYVSAASLGTNSANLAIGVAGVSNMDALTSSTGETRVYYQNSTTRGITALSVTNAFNVGHFETSIPLVPSGEVRQSVPSPIAVASIGDPWTEIHVFFVSPTNILSEYIWTASTNTWQGGPSCTACLTSDGYIVSTSSNMLYALATTTSTCTTWRVGFVSAGVSNTITEVVNTGSGWILAPLAA